MTRLWAFMRQQSHATQLHSAESHEIAVHFLLEGRWSVAAAALSPGEHNYSTVLPTDKALSKSDVGFDHVMPCCTEWIGARDYV